MTANVVLDAEGQEVVVGGIYRLDLATINPESPAHNATIRVKEIDRKTVIAAYEPPIELKYEDGEVNVVDECVITKPRLLTRVAEG